MNIKEELKKSIIRNQEIHMSSNLSRDELEQVANYLQYHFNQGDLPHWRPIAFTFHHAEDTFMRSLQKSNPMLGDSVQTIANRIANKVPVGEFYVPPKDMWGYTTVGDVSPMSNEWADSFGYNADEVHGVGVKVPVRRRDILMGDASLYNIAFCRDIISEEDVNHKYGVEIYEVPTSDTTTPFKHYNIHTTELRPICSDNQPLHEYNKTKENSARLYGMGTIRPLFIILFKYGSSPKTSIQNSYEVIPELRSSFCFCSTDYRLSHLVRVEGIHSNIINLEFWGSEYNETQLEAMLKNI